MSLSFILCSHYEKIEYVKGQQNNSHTTKILPRCDPAPGFEIP